jgi:LPXTG-motif cell wall-anchored protein
MNQILMLSLIGLVTSIGVSILLLKDKLPGVSLLLSFAGFVGGWLGGMVWVFVTGGFDYSLTMISPPITIALFFDWFILKYFDIRMRIPKKYKFATSKNITIGVFFFMTLVLVFSWVMPVSLSSNILTATPVDFPEDILNVDGDFDGFVTDVNGFIDIDLQMLVVNFPRITAENSAVDDYLSFEVQFDVSGDDWLLPYIKIAVVDDVDENGYWNSGDELWDDYAWKLTPGGSDNWRTALGYEWVEGSGYNPLYQINKINRYGDILPMPVFHSSTNQYQHVIDDTGALFGNTPEGYTSPKDQLSWRVEGNTLEWLETVDGFTSIPNGGSTIITGRIFCREAYKGQNLIVIEAFDYTPGDDVFADLSSVSSETFRFEIRDSDPDPDPDIPIFGSFDNWGVVVGGGILILLGSFVLRRRKKVPTEIFIAPQPPVQYRY